MINRQANLQRGFTLIELMVVISIIGVLSAMVVANVAGSRGKGRDLDRQADLRALQIAIEAYKQVHGRYPAMGCTRTIASASNPTTGSGFAHEAVCNGDDYIIGHKSGVNFVPDFMNRLPKDPRRDGDEEGFAYTTNTDGTVYKVMAMRTVESEQVTYAHPFKSCDIVGNPDGSAPIWNNSTYNNTGWCSSVRYGDPRSGNPVTGIVADCRQTDDGN